MRNYIFIKDSSCLFEFTMKILMGKKYKKSYKCILKFEIWFFSVLLKIKLCLAKIKV